MKSIQHILLSTSNGSNGSDIREFPASPVDKILRNQVFWAAQLNLKGLPRDFLICIYSVSEHPSADFISFLFSLQLSSIEVHEHLESITRPLKMSFLTTLGLRALPPNAPSPRNLAAPFLFANWLWANALLSTRTPKQYLGIDNNVSPREDLSKAGSTLPPRTLAMLKRWEAAHANSMEGYAFFAAAVLLALHAGVEKTRVNGLMALYSVARLAYAACYICIEDENWSRVRGYCFWIGNGACISLVWLAGKRL